MNTIRFLLVVPILACQLMVSGQSKGLYFKRIDEPREKAFSLLVPKGWVIEGGALRLLSDKIAGASNMVECKFDMAVRSADGKVILRWLPDMLCIDQAVAFGNPEGAIFNNTLVRKKRTPDKFITEVAIPYSHPNASGVKVMSGKSLPAVAELFLRAADPGLKAVTNVSYRAGMIEYSYYENGVRYQERMVAVIEDYGANGAGMWKNKSTILARAPYGELDQWEPVLGVICNSGIWRAGWVGPEINNQRKRSGQMLLQQQEIQALTKAINDNQSRTYSEINKDMYLTLTEQNEYKNPHTGTTERDTDHWKYRWVNNLGEIVYSDYQNYDPNHDIELNKSGFKLSTPRK